MNGKKDCENLMSDILPLARRMLEESGEFYPYGGYMKLSGEIVHVGAEDEDTDRPKSRDLIYVLQDSLSTIARTRGCKATAIVFDVRVNLPGTQIKTDAIQVCLEHIDGYSAEVFIPYEISQARQVTYGAIFAQEGRHEIFGGI